ncbi:MAG: GNAT family N-acetyltransferase [Ardenticatenaceae bacterium]|nr:GNAT family N-acetyltransferase [Anaerolineales bacterium]MCB8921989.1 GNAT family N-acetyltransferase [Ardenticatenaceae bacterium]MCB8989565.1 GNAT family N-acetyltransferase [Ardenticatenaceae bacterium]MCB9003108.1 GNAT family N-acetyltransferase [Ardenticatenaceae bacterium]
MEKQMEMNDVFVADAPDVAGLHFRGFLGESDYPKMVAVITASLEADGMEWAISVEDTARDYAHMSNCDPFTDMIFAEVDGEVVGYGRCWHDQLLDKTRVYSHFAYLHPNWRDMGIRRAMTRYLEQRLHDIAADEPDDGPKVYQCWASDGAKHWEALLQSEGYEAIRYGYDMVRPNLEDIPDRPLPDGLEMRPADLSQWRQIWEAAREAFRDHWGAREWTEENFVEWREHPTFNPALWQVAWDGDEVAGGVLTFIDEQENEEYGRLRGYTETIFTRRPWRKRGLAHALIAHSLQRQKELGMTESALGVDAENLSGALNIYKSMGFEIAKRAATYRKAIS